MIDLEEIGGGGTDLLWWSWSVRVGWESCWLGDGGSSRGEAMVASFGCSGLVLCLSVCPERAIRE